MDEDREIGTSGSRVNKGLRLGLGCVEARGGEEFGGGHWIWWKNKGGSEDRVMGVEINSLKEEWQRCALILCGGCGSC